MNLCLIKIDGRGGAEILYAHFLCFCLWSKNFSSDCRSSWDCFKAMSGVADMIGQRSLGNDF